MAPKGGKEISEEEGALPPQIVAQAEAAILGNSGTSRFEALQRQPSRAQSEYQSGSSKGKSVAGLSRQVSRCDWVDDADLSLQICFASWSSEYTSYGCRSTSCVRRSS